MSDTYDAIGRGYRKLRRADPRLAARLTSVIGDQTTVLNVGAGTGSYEPARRGVIAVDPSMVMLGQRPSTAAPAVQAVAEALPFHDQAFDVVLAILTVHHWSRVQRGLEECARIARERVVILTWDPDADGFWLVQQYLPEILAIDRKTFPRLSLFEAVLGPVEVHSLPIPADCVDGFLGAYWQRPSAYLDQEVREGISTFSKLTSVDAQLARLKRDLASGRWYRRNGSLRERADLDVGYRLIIAEKASR